MPAAIQTAQSEPSISTSLRAKLLNIFATPGEVFEEIVTTPPRLVNWLVPTLLVWLAGIAFPGDSRATLGHAEKLSGGWQIVSLLGTGLGVFAGTFWSAFVLCFIGRVFLKVRFSFRKALEIVGLTSIILVLGTLVTALLMAAAGDVSARPAMSLFAADSGVSNQLRAVLSVMNLFHLWTATVLAIGLSRLSRVSFKESAFWVFGYWVLARIALILLA